MNVRKSVIHLGIAVAVLALLDMLLLFIFVSIGNDSGAAYGAERFTFYPVAGDSVRLEWAPNTEPDLAGYTVYAATNAGTSAVWTGSDTTARIKVPMATFWERARFRLTALDTAGNESAPSDTISTILCKELRLVGDIDGNGRVNVLDKALYWLAAGTKRGDLMYSEKADFNGDGAVNVLDKGLMNLNSGAQR